MLRADPDDSDACYNRGLAHGRTGNAEQALADRDRSLETSGVARQTLPAFLAGQGRDDSAIDGDVGPGSRALLRAHAEAGCPLVDDAPGHTVADRDSASGVRSEGSAEEEAPESESNGSSLFNR